MNETNQPPEETFLLQDRVPFSSLLYRVEDVNEEKKRQAASRHRPGEAYRFLYWE